MSELRGIRLLNAVENGTVLGAELNIYLTDPGRLAELTVLYSQRGQAKRISNGQTTMTAIVSSIIATNAAFVQATESNDTIVAAIVQSSLAMSTVSTSASVLQKVSDNPTSWNYFRTSIYYEFHIKSIIANLSGVNPNLYGTASSLILDPVSMGDISVSERGMRALVNSTPSIVVMAGSSVAMALVADNTVAISLVANQTEIMPTIAASNQAMNEIVTRTIATGIMANNAGAIKAIAANNNAFNTFLSGAFFTTYLKSILANLAGVVPSNYADVNALIDDPIALGAISNSESAVKALKSSSSAMLYLAGSTNIGIILSSTLAMGLIGPDTAAMSSFLGAPGAWSGLFSSSVAKGYIVESTPLVNIVAANTALITYLKTIAVVASATGIPDGNATALQPFSGIPGKVLVLLAKEAGIAATFNPYNFGGSVLAGSQAGATLSLTAAAQLAHVAGYTNMTWNLQGIGVTAATLPIITYVNMA